MEPLQVEARPAFGDACLLHGFLHSDSEFLKLTNY